MKIGTPVKTNRHLVGVPAGVEGVVIEDYGSGITVAWDLPDRPYPKDKTPEQVKRMWAIEPGCPLRDGFDKKTELQYLEKVDD